MSTYVVRITNADGTQLYYRAKRDEVADINRAQLYWRIKDAEYRKRDIEWLHDIVKRKPSAKVEIVEVKVSIKEKS